MYGDVVVVSEFARFAVSSLSMWATKVYSYVPGGEAGEAGLGSMAKRTLVEESVDIRSHHDHLGRVVYAAWQLDRIALHMSLLKNQSCWFEGPRWRLFLAMIFRVRQHTSGDDDVRLGVKRGDCHSGGNLAGGGVEACASRVEAGGWT